MASILPISNSSSIIPPVSPTNSTNPNQTTDAPPPSAPPLPSAPPPQSSPPPAPSTPPPETPSPPPPKPPPSPPPSPVAPPPSPVAPPPSPVAPPPSPPASPPPPPSASPPPPSAASPPPESPSPTVAPPPPPPTTSPSPPPPATAPPPATSPPPPHHAQSPKHSPPPPTLTPPPASSPPIPPTTSPPPASTASPPSDPSSSLPPAISPHPAPYTNASSNGTLPASPPPTEKPTARSTPSDSNITSDSTSRNSGGFRAGGAAAMGGIMGFLALSLVILAAWYTHKRKRRKNGFNLNYTMPSPFASSQNSDSSFLRSQYSSQLAGSASATNYMYSPDGGIGSSRSCFSYQELSTATDGFSEYKVLGEGGFGCVYKGNLVDGREVAVKQLKAGGGQGEREFRAEVEIISRIHHRHLVSLVGYCIAENQRLLVYDYVPNDTLHYHLHDKNKSAVMDWASRVKVAAGAARGLAYLHEDCQPRIIHRDIKSTNILLDNNFEALVADFGLAKLALELELHTHVSTRVMGTFGYLAPEYASTGKLTEKSDVYSFGVVLLELITGRKPVDSSQPLGDESLVEWARPLLTEALDKEEFGEVVDARLGDNFVPSEMFRMIEAAAACVRHLASKRPRMSQVVRALESMEELADLNNGMKPGQSGIFTSREHSAQIRMFQRMAFGSQDYSSENMNNSQSSWRS